MRKGYQPRIPGHEIFADGLRALEDMEVIEEKTLMELGFIPRPQPRAPNPNDPRLRATRPTLTTREKSPARGRSVDQGDKRRIRDPLAPLQPMYSNAVFTTSPREPDTESRDPRLRRRLTDITGEEADSLARDQRRMTYGERVAIADRQGAGRGEQAGRRKSEDYGRSRDRTQNQADIWGRREY